MSKTVKMLAPTKIELWIIRFMILIGCFSILNFVYWFLQPEYKLYPLLYWLLCFTLFYGILRTLYIWYYYWNISVPEIPPTEKAFTVDILTTFFPGEPYEMIVETLNAIQNITYPHTAYLCDEANDPYLKEVCKALGVIHVTRNNRIDAKAGNINNALKIATGEICVILDPDHIPDSDFLDPIVPFFNDPKIGFVQIVQSYYNTDKTLVARGAAEQTYQFYGPMMMTMNSYGTVNAIGANCTFRRSALDSIGGHAAGLAEDMHTAMLLHSKGWNSVYVPQVLAKGLVPSSLSAFFKQQIKWARGTFDLLFYVYPKLFTKFTWRQKVHYGLLPLHFLIGVIYLVNFLIPILSLLLYKMPWRGNILYFAIILMPMVMSNFFLRVYIQRWVIEKKERGFHLMGGFLQIASWWYYLLGFVYTLFKKRVPYIPTPKEGEKHSNYRIILPNIIVAVLSIAAVIFGLYKDFTPFSIIMSGFALLNASFMIFSIYLTNQKTNKNQFLRKGLRKEIVNFFIKVKGFYRKFSTYLFHVIRPIALSSLLIVLGISIFAQINFRKYQWEDIAGTEVLTEPMRYLGIFYPKVDNGLSDSNQISDLEKKETLKFDIISFYVPWGDKNSINSNSELISRIYKSNALPMISWEPWASNFEISDSLTDLKNEKHVLKHINNGQFNAYIKEFAYYLKSFNKPVFLRFAHEFDNPFYPWSETGGNTPEDFKEAWIHIYNIFKASGADNVFWVWNPWKVETMESYFPGNAYIDWVGITGLNYGTYNKNELWQSFESLYNPIHDKLKGITNKPVMISEFGSLKVGGSQELWMEHAIKSINKNYKEIEAIVLFNSSVDDNIPDNITSTAENLDWTLNSFDPIKINYTHTVPHYIFKNAMSLSKEEREDTGLQSFKKQITGVAYKKGQNWIANNYVLNRDVLKEDFDRMKEIGLHTIKYEGLNIYDSNVINIAREKSMALLFSFWIPNSMNFVEDDEVKHNLRTRILEKVEKLKNEKHILSWNIGNDFGNYLRKTYNEPVLSYQIKAYLEWLKELIGDIKKIDSSRPVVIDIQMNNKTLDRVSYMHDIGIKVDKYGFIVTDFKLLKLFKSDPRSEKISYLISEIDSNSFFEFRDELLNTSIVLKNWQDKWEYNKVSFDGIIDFKGRKKDIYNKLKFRASRNIKIENDESIRILVPSILLYPNDLVRYNAVILKDGKWIYPDTLNYEDTFEWVLVKKDPYGNTLALKELGKGISKLVTIPKDYSKYELMLTHIKANTVNSVRTQLNTSINNLPIDVLKKTNTFD